MACKGDRPTGKRTEDSHSCTGVGQMSGQLGWQMNDKS